MRFARIEWFALAFIWLVWALVFAGAGKKATHTHDPEARNLHFIAGLSLFVGVGCLRRTGKRPLVEAGQE